MSDQTLEEAKEWLRVAIFEGGAECPCCTQFAKVYRRNISGTQGRLLIAMYESNLSRGLAWDEFQYTAGRKNLDSSGQISGLAYWGLVEEEAFLRPDGGRSGWWRVTQKGKNFLLDQITVPKYALIYDGKCLGFEGPECSIRDVLKTKFRYDELMSSFIGGSDE